VLHKVIDTVNVILCLKKNTSEAIVTLVCTIGHYLTIMVMLNCWEVCFRLMNLVVSTTATKGVKLTFDTSENISHIATIRLFIICSVTTNHAQCFDQEL
jgi:hypothetical protein